MEKNKKLLGGVYIYKRPIFLCFLFYMILLITILKTSNQELHEIDEAFDKKEKCILIGEVNKIIKNKQGQDLYLKNIQLYLDGGRIYFFKNILVKDKKLIKYNIKNIIKVEGIINKIEKPTNPGQFNLPNYYKGNKIDYIISSNNISIINNKSSILHLHLNKIKDKLILTYTKILEAKEAGLIIAMVLGDKSLLDDDIKSLYKNSGISHILAISGLHISLIGLGFYKLIIKINFPRKLSAIITIFILYLYCVLTNYSVSTVRALIMIALFLFAEILGRTYDIITAASIAGLLIIIINPHQIYQASFLLSFTAVFAIAIMIPAFEELFESRNMIIKSILASTSINLFTLPISLFFFFEIYTYSILVNIILLPLMSILLITSLFAGLIGSLNTSLAIFIVGTSNYILKFYELISSVFIKLPKSVLTIGRPSLIKVIIYYILILVFIYLSYKFKKKACVILLLVGVFLILSPTRNGLLEVTMLDVGQGDGIFIKSANEKTFLIDGGSSNVRNLGENRLIPFLKSKGVSEIDYIIISHLDSDHYNGIIEIINNQKDLNPIKIKNIMIPYISLKDDEYKDFEDIINKYNINLIYIKEGDLLYDKDMQIQCYHPSRSFVGESKNSSSAILNFRYKDFTILFTGDIEGRGEDYLVDKLRTINREYISVLKVAHHGSKNSTSLDFLDLTRPRLAMISCSSDNSYGHPHKELIERLEKTNSQVVITANSGAITITTDGNGMQVKRFLK